MLVRFIGKRFKQGGYVEEMTVAEVVECEGMRFLLADHEGGIVSFDYLTGTELLRSHDKDMAVKFLSGAAKDPAYLRLVRGRIKDYGAVELFVEEAQEAKYLKLDAEFCTGDGAAKGEQDGTGYGGGFLDTGRGTWQGAGIGCGALSSSGQENGQGPAEGEASGAGNGEGAGG